MFAHQRCKIERKFLILYLYPLERNLNGIQTNTVGTINMLGLAKRTKARILIASTSEVINTTGSDKIKTD